MHNNLALEERLVTTKLIGHDIASRLISLHTIADSAVEVGVRRKDKEYEQKRLYALFYHVRRVEDSIWICCKDNIELDEVESEKLKSIMEYISIIIHPDLKNTELKIRGSSTVSHKFFSSEPLLYSTMYNLTKNAYEQIKKNGGELCLSVSPFSGTVPNVAYASNTPTTGEYIRLSVHDTGQGFNKSRPIEDYVKLGVTTKQLSEGLGLYYVTIACKLLGCHLSIDSEPGNTSVAIYHPIKLKN